MQNEDALKTAIITSPSWEQAVEDYIACTTQIGQPFTSGHITTILRVYRPEFKFAHARIGEKCQDMFYNGEINFSGGTVQVPRVCAGVGRTPAGTTVFCYAGDKDDADAFPFELDIPSPGHTLTVMPTEHPIQITPTAPTPPKPVDMRARVHSDHRLCVPRVALEALMAAAGRAFRVGDKVYVRFEDTPGRAIVSLDQQPNSVDYDIGKNGGRVLFPKPGSGQYNHGDIFAVDLTNDELVIDTDTAL